MGASTLLRRSVFVATAVALVASLSVDAAPADIYKAAVEHAGRTTADRERDKRDHPAEILSLAGIKPGMRVADVLAGGGYYSELLSYVVGPKGEVLLINNAAFDNWSGDGLKKRLEKGRLANVKHKTVDLNRMDLGEGTLDAVFLIRVYHDLYWVDNQGTWPKIDVKATLDQIARALKPGGVLLVVDHHARAGTGSTEAGRLHRIEESFARSDFEARGLKLAATSDLLRKPDDKRDQLTYEGPMFGKTDQFVLLFRK